MNATASVESEIRSESPASVVREFLVLLQDEDFDGALDLLTEDVAWENVSLPTVKGRAKVEKLFRKGNELGGGFRVHFENIAADGDIVLTERIDAITLGRFHHQFWVAGRFELRDGRIAVWHDAFDWRDYFVGFLRALVGLISPKLNRRWPTQL
jgi:limonene-1,2-epoxide hydrolase